jgi:hypothetical protein
MKGMTPEETASYIRHHLQAAGRTADLFTDDAVTQIHQAARGRPRTVNNGAPRVWWRLDSPQMLLSGWLLSSTVPPPGGTTV